MRVFSNVRPAVIAGYLFAYVVLDWVSYIHPVAPYAITPWNPPPGLSLALLLIFGLRYAPALFVAALLAKVVVRGGGNSLLEITSYAAIIAGGYTAMAAFLPRVARFDRGIHTLRERERELERAMRAAAAAEMASVLAHELNQPLTAASNYA